MVIKKTSLGFHQTFKPERKCLTALLTSLLESSDKTPEEISKITGIPTGKSSGKVVPTICYLEYMGMISAKLSEKKYHLNYTEIGQQVQIEDPGLLENLTLLLLHCMLVRRGAGASLWSLAICNILPKYNGEINKSNFEKELELYFKKEVAVAPFHGTYSGLFEQLGILKVDSDGYTLVPHEYNPEFIYLYALILYEYWNDWYSLHDEEEKREKHLSNVEITSLQLEETGFRFPFGWTEQKEYQVLEHLHDKGIIVLNRQMSPFTIRKISSLEQILELLYTELC